ncbi:unnamed protein product [Ixodes hexagonus]
MINTMIQALCILSVLPFYQHTHAVEYTSLPDGLDLVVGLFRHGDRAPLRSYPNDPYWNSTLWDLGYGELTHRGIDTMRNVGRYLKERYKHFLTEDRTETNVRSSPKSRCFNSASFLLYELYPATPPYQFEVGEQWFPFPMTRVPENNDKYTCFCFSPEIKNLVKKLLNPFSGHYRLLWFLMRASRKLGLSIFKDAEIIPDTLDALLVQKEYGLELPQWFEKRLNRLSDVSREVYVLIAQALIKNMGGELLSDIAAYLEEKYQLAANRTDSSFAVPGLQKETHKTRLKLFSYHDLNIMATLRALDDNFWEKPFYGSIVLFEVMKKESVLEPDIRILYRNGTNEPTLFPISGCSAPCSVRTFIAMIRGKFPTEFTAESCGYPEGYPVL